MGNDKLAELREWLEKQKKQAEDELNIDLREGYSQKAIRWAGRLNSFNRTIAELDRIDKKHQGMFRVGEGE